MKQLARLLSLIASIAVIAYFLIVLLVSFPCRLSPQNHICQTSNQILSGAGLYQNWSMFAPDVPKQSFWVSGKIFCQGQEPKAWGLERIDSLPAFEKILNVRLQRYQSVLLRKRNGQLNQRLLSGYAQYISEKQSVCPRDQVQKVQLVMESESLQPEKFQAMPTYTAVIYEQ